MREENTEKAQNQIASTLTRQASKKKITSPILTPEARHSVRVSLSGISIVHNRQPTKPITTIRHRRQKYVTLDLLWRKELHRIVAYHTILYHGNKKIARESIDVIQTHHRPGIAR